MARMMQNRLAEVAEVRSQVIEIIDAEVLRKLRKFAHKSLKTLRRFCGAEVPPYPPKNFRSACARCGVLFRQFIDGVGGGAP